ncbi:MAG TPA: CDP-alcohol phosphatidyltransferase family protein [Vicinamibacterales bacterium]|nr:CDP-alcohol phosphatidyltransferase family protein [Vicinamibacterales bacterium]
MTTATATTTTADGKTFRSAIRLQGSFLTAIEKRTLRWLAVRLPASVNSDDLTILALVAMGGVGLSYWLAASDPIGLLLAIVFLAINWFGDSLDGTLARVRDTQRPRYGYYVDHIVDVIGTFFLFGGLALSGYMSPAVAALLLIAYFMVCLEVYLATVSLGTFKMDFMRIGPTELRILLSVGNIVLLFHPMATVFGHTFKLFDVGGVIGAAGMFGVLIISTIRNTRTLYRAEPLPRR